MEKRLKLQSLLEELLESDHVYYQPPESMKLSYTAIKYSKTLIDTRYANNGKYSNMDRYNLIVISRRPDDPIIAKLLELPYCSYDRYYVSDNLHHDSLILYY